MWHIYTMEYYSARKRNEIELEKQIPYANTYIWNLKKEKKMVLKNLGAGQD